MARAGHPPRIKTRAATPTKLQAPNTAIGDDLVSPRFISLCSIMTTILLRLAMAPRRSPLGAALETPLAGGAGPHVLRLFELQRPTTRETSRQCPAVED